MRVIHLSGTPLAGAPLRLVRALARNGIDARLVDLMRSPVFGHDLLLDESKDRCKELLRDADLIHLHNLLPHSPVLRDLQLSSLRAEVIVHMHGQPKTVAARAGLSVAELGEHKGPMFVVGQFQERFYPRARVVPNLVSVPAPCCGLDYDILYAPTHLASAWAERWDTKGAPETWALLKAFRREGLRIYTPDRVPHDELLRARASSRVVIDELVTGSFHLSALEGAAAGKPTLSFLDERVQRVLAELTGVHSHPFLNVRLEEAEGPLRDVLGSAALAESLGESAASWMAEHWTDERLLVHYLDVYRDLSRCERQAALRVNSAAERYFAVTLPDRIHASRRRRALASRRRFLGSVL